AFVIAVVGLYSVMAFAVVQRGREIGIRIALGARPTRVLREVLARGALLTALGIALGVVGALALSGVATGVLFGVGPTDPVALGGSAALLLAVALVACYVPARRASRTDPAIV